MKRILGVFLVALACSSVANDTWLVQGGSPITRRKHPTVRMREEHVRMWVYWNHVDTDCTFVFVNDGPATSVRIGFPDDAYRELPEDFAPELKGFRSWVNGVPVATKFEKVGWQAFHAKTVRFPAYSTVRVRDRYRVEIGGSVGYGPYYTNIVAYILHTGRTWKGNIGRTIVDVYFDPEFFSPTSLISKRDFGIGLDRMEAKDGSSGNKARNSYLESKSRALLFQGPSRPTLKNGRVRFIRSNYEPTQEHDVWLEFLRRAKRT
ncbi:MAG TPA: hypothetical protein VGE01_06470 [Fimbriimonas sp.]